jgi:hypothetical protein
MIKYESVLNLTEISLRDLISFLNIECTDEFLHHEKYIGNKVIVSNSEWSFNQIKKGISDYLNLKQGQNDESNFALLNMNYSDKAFIQSLIMFKKFNYVS